MATVGTSLPFDRPTIVASTRPNRHARDFADRRQIPAAALIAVFESSIALGALVAVLIVTNRDAMPQGLDAFLSMRVTLRNLLLLAILATVWPLLFAVCGLYTLARVRDAMSERLRVCAACLLGSTLPLVIATASASGGLEPLSIGYFWIATTATTLALRQGRRALSRHRERRRVLIVGTGGRALALWRTLARDEHLDYDLAGFLDTADSRPASPEVAARCIGTLDDLEPLLMRHAIDEVCLALPIRSHYPEIQEAILVCERVGVRAKYQATLFDNQVAWPRFDEPGNPTVTLHVVPSDYRLAIKRLVDIGLSAVALILLLPILTATALVIKATSPGPVIFAQERYGLNRRRFRMFKFRTMLVNAEERQASLEARNEADGPVFKIADDPRITPLGRFLRRTSIDELPQLVNVLRGEMSLVGPRPLPLRDVMRFTHAADMRRFSVRPGLTCLWQISGRSTLSFSDWIRLDLTYIDRWSLSLDLLILLRTVPVVFLGRGAR